MMLACRSYLSWRNHSSGPPSPPLAPCKAVSISVWFDHRNTPSALSCSAGTSVPDIAQTQSSTAIDAWPEFAESVSGEWDGFGADFSSEGQPLELPESVVPEAYREWEVKVFDWQTQCPTLAQPHTPTMIYKSIKLLPTVGCEADAATRYSIDERSIGGGAINNISALASAYSATGSYVAVWPIGDKLLELEHCLTNPKDKKCRVRIYQTIRLVETAQTRIKLERVKVFCEQWYGPFRNGDQLGGCAIRDSGFASTPATQASDVVGAWRGLHAAATIDAIDSSSIQQLWNEKEIEIVRDESELVLLPRGLWCSLKEGNDGETVAAAGWLYEKSHTITSRGIFSYNCELEEISIGTETAESDA